MVYLAHDTVKDKICCVKVFRGMDEEMTKAF